jgi:hypothetical protein
MIVRCPIIIILKKKGCEVAYKKRNIIDFLGLLILERKTGSNFNILVSLCFLFSLGLLILLHSTDINFKVLLLN